MLRIIKQYSVVVSLFVLACVLVLLFSAPEAMFSPGVSFIDSELHRTSGDEIFVRTKLDFGNEDHLRKFPMKIDEWEGYDYTVTDLEKSLNADVILMRAYGHPDLYQPVFFLAMQSKTESSFHPPVVCYPSLGYNIEQEEKEKVYLSDTSWAQNLGNPGDEYIPFKKLVVSKEANGKLTERRVVLYCYIKPNRLTSDALSMVRVSIVIPTEGSYEAQMNILKSFTALTIPHLFEISGGETRTILNRLTNSGFVGYIILCALLCLPLAILLIPRFTDSKSPSKGRMI